MLFWTFWRFSTLIWAKLAPIQSKRHLQHESRNLFPLASCLTHCCLGKCRNQNVESFLTRKRPTSLSFLFDQLLSLQGLLPVQKFLRKVAKCSGRKLCSEFFTLIFEHFCAYLRLHWANDPDMGITGKIFVNFGQRWWHQKWDKGQYSSWPDTAGKGRNGSFKLNFEILSRFSANS